MKLINIFSFWCVASFTQDDFAIYSHCYMLQSFILLLLNSIPSHEYSAICLRIHFWVDIWVPSSFWLIQITLLWTFMDKFLYEHSFLFLLDK